MNNLGNLPSEIVLLIIKHVPKDDLYACALINRQFYATTNPFLWRSIYIPDHFTSRRFTAGVATAQHHVGRYIQAFDSFSSCANTGLETLIKHNNNRHLKKLTLLKVSGINNKMIRLVARRCPHLTSLHLRSTCLTLSSFQSLGRHCRQLGHLELLYCARLPSDLFQALEGCPLHTLVIDCGLSLDWTVKTVVDLLRFDQLTHLQIHSFQGSLMEKSIFYLLKASTLPHPYLSFFGTAAAAAAAATAVRKPWWPHLTHLLLSPLSDVDDTMLIAFLRLHAGLESITLQYSRFISDVTLDAIATCLPFVTHVCLSHNNHISGRGVRRLVQHCTRLTSVDVSGCGVLMGAFPELIRDNQSTIINYVEKLDQEAIDKIRHGNKAK